MQMRDDVVLAAPVLRSRRHALGAGARCVALGMVVDTVAAFDVDGGGSSAHCLVCEECMAVKSVWLWTERGVAVFMCRLNNADCS